MREDLWQGTYPRLVEVRRVEVAGQKYLQLGTRLLESFRLETAHGGIWDAADLNWWWRLTRSSDALSHSFWLDDGEPVAGVLETDWGEQWQCDPITLPTWELHLRDEVWDQAVSATRERRHLAIPVRTDDDWAVRQLTQWGFTADAEGASTTAWMPAQDAPDPTALPNGYRLLDRTQTRDRPHHLIRRNAPDVEERLAQTPLYDPSLDLVVLAADEVAGYAMFWMDPTTAVGMVEPMRTEEAHERQGLAGSLLRAGLARLVSHGARQLKIGFESPVAESVYARAGFVADSTVNLFRRE